MRIAAGTSRLAFAATYVTRHQSGVCVGGILPQTSAAVAMMSCFSAMNRNGATPTTPTTRLNGVALPTTSSSSSSSSTRLYLSSSGSSGSGMPPLQNIGREEMEEIIDDFENGGREESGYVIMDVREEYEIAETGKLSPNTHTLPLQKLMQVNGFALEEDEFLDVFGFDKPALDETLVFSCKAGIRSVSAAQLAGLNGYGKLVNYKGGANEWFRPF
jgi:rhodanese-related sulfurtransferase